MTVKKFNSDIDIDFGNRELILEKIPHIHSSLLLNGQARRHNSGVHVTSIPYDPVNNIAAIDYNEAEARGYIKLDFLNVWVYQWVRDERHLTELMAEPNWQLLKEREFVEKLIHLANHYEAILAMPEPVDSIPRLAMMLSIIRPAKRHLIGLPWSEVAKTVWEKDDELYTFKKSHSIAYANLVVVHMNLLEENPKAFSLPE
jgi:hypothetical protein